MTRHLLTDDRADALAAGGTLTLTDQWSAWDWIRWGAPFLLTGMGGGIVTIIIIIHIYD